MRGPAGPGAAGEVVVAVGPAFADTLARSLGGLSHGEVLRAIVDGIVGEGLTARIVRVRHTADLGLIGTEGARCRDRE